MTMTDEQKRMAETQTAILHGRNDPIPGYGENSQQVPPPGPHPDAGGSIMEVAESREHPKEKCPECGKMISKKNLVTHRRKIHDVRQRPGRPRKEVEVAKTPKPQRFKPTAEEIVLTTVQLRWPSGVPVDKVAALMVWAKATERFFND